MIEQKKIDQIDQNELFRQLAVYGHQVQAKLMALRVFIYGINGLGIQVAKNLILAGPKQVTIYDPTICSIGDVGRNFYIKQEDVGKMTRVDACQKFLHQLNQNVHLKISTDNTIETIVATHDCVVVLDQYNRKYLIQLNKACRQKNIGFIYGGNLGIYGFTFIDFGQNHKVFDTTGQQQKNIYIALITKQRQGAVLLHPGKKHGLSDGDTVVFRQVQGMAQLNRKQYKIKVRAPDCFTIGDTSNFSQYTTGGIATQVKVPVIQKFYSLQKSLGYPYAPGTHQLPSCNWQLFGQPEQFHVILNSILNFYQKFNRLPQNLNHQDATTLLQLCEQWKKNKINQQGFQFNVQEIKKRLVDCISLFSQTQISPVCSFWGGIITQEIIKLTGKYSPLRQWLHHAFFQIFTPEHFAFQKSLPTLSYLNTRYRDYNILFGDNFVEKTSKSNTFLIGAGALGCQFIKMFALMGFSSHEKSRVLCTDDDNIQISNLNRQFLFRKNHVGKNKSQTACHIGNKINNKCNFQSVKLKVSPQTQDYFNDQFWQSLDLVVNAVDNVKARQFIDRNCVWYEKPFFESGTLGTKCHSQIIIPHHTLSYNDIIDPPEQQFAVCTLKLFPYQIQHTIQWARQYFETILAIPSQDLKQYYANTKQFIDKLLKENKKNLTIAKQRLQRMKKLHQINISQSYQSCVQVAIRSFEHAFHHQIAQLLTLFPQDYISPETGHKYWTGLKRVPQILKLNNKDKLHLGFIQATANILAQIFKIPQQKNVEKIAQLISQVKPSDFVPRKIKLKVDQSKNDNSALQQQPAEQDQAQIAHLVDYLLSVNTTNYKQLNVVVFEKDDPTNWHIEFMGGVANLRARNYKIEEVDNFKVKLIAGKIIPAIATSTALIVGAVGIQIIKYLLLHDKSIIKQNYFKNVTVNLALPLFIFNDPIPAIQIIDKQFDPLMGQKVRAIPGKFTKWDKIPMQGPLTLQELKTSFEQEYDIKIQAINYGNYIIYCSFGEQAKISKQRLSLRIEQIIQKILNKKLPKNKRCLNLQISNSVDKNNVFCQIPDIKYII